MSLAARLRRIGAALALVPFCLAQVGATYDAPQAGAVLGAQWPTYNNRLEGQRFSPLKQVTPQNAAQLGEVCRVQIDGPTSYSAGLIVTGGVIYTATGRNTVAIDAATCALKWTHVWTPEEEEIVPSNRGVAVLDGRVFRGTGDGRLLALDAETGRLLWKDVIGAPRLGEFASAAPLAWQGVVYMGIAGGDRGVRGRVMAFDAATGRELWRFHTIPMGDEVGARSWKAPGTAKTGGGAVWGAMSLDVTTGELFVATGNPWPDIARHYRPGENLFTNSIVVLDARTGALKWWHQATPEDGHDLDLAAPPVLYRSGTRDIVAFAGKDGYVRALDRDTRKPLFKTPITTIKNEGVFATPEGVHICPGFAGGVEWNGPALVPEDKLLITGVVDWCFTITAKPLQYRPPGVDYGGTVRPDPQASGWVVAVDSETGEVKWRYHADKPVIAGVTPTAGGVTFTGDLDGNFLTLDTRTGALLAKAPTGGALAGGVVTYEIGGRQYVAFASGNVSRSTFGALGVPSVVVMALGAHGAAPAPAAPAPQAAAGAADVGHGKAVYGQVCSGCHGETGDLVAGHSLANLSARRDLASTIAFIKDPDPPMPKLYPGTLKAQDVADVAAYLQQGVGR